MAASRSDPGERQAARPAFQRAKAEVGGRSDMVAYFSQVERVLAEVCYTRAVWRAELDAAVKLLARGKLVAGLAQAARLGHAYESSFADHGRAISEIKPPHGAERYHALLLDLLARLANANASLGRAATHRDTKLLMECGSLLRLTKQRFTDLSREKERLGQRWRLDETYDHEA